MRSLSLLFPKMVGLANLGMRFLYGGGAVTP